MGRLQSITVIAAFSFAAFAPFVALAGPLSEVAHSTTMDKFKDRRSRFQPTREEEMAHWLREGSNYGSIFLQRTDGHKLLSWIMPNRSPFSLNKVETDRLHGGLAKIKGYYSSPIEGRLNMTLVAPHPKSFEMIKFDLSNEYKEFKIPQHITAEKLTVKDRPATLYIGRLGLPTLVVELDRYCLLVIKSRQENAKTLVLNFAESLELSRFDQKLNT